MNPTLIQSGKIEVQQRFITLFNAKEYAATHGLH